MFDYGAVRAVLLDPLGPGDSRRYRTAVFDHRGDAPADAAPEASADVIIGSTDPVRPRVVKWPARPPEAP